MSHIDCIHPDEDEGDGGSVSGDSFAFQQSGHRRELSRPDVDTVSIGGNVTPPLSNENHEVLDNHEDHRVTVSGDRRNVSMRSSTETHDVLDTTMVPLSRVFERVGRQVGSPSAIAPVNHAYLCLNVTDYVIRPAIIPFLNNRLENVYQGHARGDSSNTIDLMAAALCLKIDHPRFLQLYIYDTHAKVANRLRNFRHQNEDTLNPEIVKGLIHVLNEHNGLVRLFRTARDRYNAGEIPSFKIRLYNKGGARGYEFPTSDVLGGIVFEDGPKSRTDFDVIIEFRGGHPQRINKLHQSYMSLQFPLLFVFGEPGFYPELVLKPRDGSGKGKKVTMNAYYKYQLHPRVKGFGLIFRCGRLFQQYVVAAFCAIEQSRLDFIRKRQNDLRSDYLLGLYDAISQGDREGIQVGSMIMLPRTFTGGPRYMYSHYLDALTICRSLGNQQFFITFTCNVKWPEIKRYMSQYPQLTPTDMADIFQKRGLPHCHTLLWVDSSSKIQDASQIDDYISAELPDPVEDPEGYKVVSKLMMHGPCGVANPSASCTEKGICNKHFPKMYNHKTFFDTNGHTHYRRRQTQVHIMKGESRLDNCNVVPYNRILCLAFRAHINVEYCGWSMLIKYLFKYISKGPDRILGKIEKSVEDASTSTSERHIQVDEIQNYVDGRFICPFEACWRIFEYPIHRREPAVQILNVHLENMQRVNFRERDRLDVIVNLPDRKKTTLTEWYVYNNEHTDGRHLTYLDFPSEFVWYSDSKSWHRRVVRTKKSLGRLTYVHPNSGDLFYFRMLLSHQKGCKSPIEVRTVNGQILLTYRAACEALGLLGDDREWDIALEESAMQDDIPSKISEATGIVNYHVNTPELQDHILYELETILNGFGKSVKEFGLPSPSERLLKDLKNKLLMEEQNYKRDALMQETALLVPKLNEDQKEIYNLIINASEQTSSGIASLLLPAGRTTHSRFKLPLELTDESVCHAKKHSQLGNLLVETNHIIWDKAPMNDKRCFEALDRRLRDLMNAPETLFGGKTIILGGDFRQTLPVKKGAAKQELIHASIAESYLWLHFRICTLKQNMRLLRSAISNDERERSKFAKWLLDVGNDEVGEPDKDNNEDTFWITVPQQYCINPSEQALSELINFIYDEATLKTPTASAFQEKAIVCPKNDTADAVNARILSSVEGVTKTYLSRDEAIPLGREINETDMLYPMKYLNTITFPGFPPHELQLKVGSPIMLLRNVNLLGGLCNRTRMIVISIMSRLIEAQIITGTRAGEKVFIHIIPLTHKDPSLSFTFKRTQFPIKLCYAMTINKSQGQSLSKIGDTGPNQGHSSPKRCRGIKKNKAIASLKVGQEDCIIEAKVYRKWISKSIPDMKEQAFCCILVDRERISNFICENTKPYQQTLGNKISLKFGKITSFQVLPGKESEFPEHHFELISYNQLSSRVPYQDKQDSKMIYPILTDYLGRVRSISDITPFQDASGRQKYRRKVDIESLDGNVVEFTMWDDLATQFNKEEVEKLPPPIIIVVSSCRVTKYRDVQLSATPATYYYINPKNQEAENAYKMFEDKYSLNPPLQVTKYRYDDPEQEKTRNRQTLYTLLQQNPTTFKGVRFTCEAMITSLNSNRSWSYASCSQCSKASTKRNGVNTCEDHGEQEPPTYRYNFKVTAADGTATAEFTFFTAAGQKIIGHPCSYLKQKYEPTDTSQLPVEMVNTIGEKHIFQIEFDPSTQKGAGRFIVNDILDINPPTEKRNTGTF
ncbi:DNA helicase [Tanacetum coccineum]